MYEPNVSQRVGLIKFTELERKTKLVSYFESELLAVMSRVLYSCFAGMMIGGYMWGYRADQEGRRKVLVVSLTVNGLFGGLASVSPWFWLFLLLRFISGIG